MSETTSRLSVDQVAPAEAGFDPDFLGVRAPLPGVGACPVAELGHTHFSVQLDTVRALAVCAAVNIDGGALVDLPRADDRQIDPRVPEDAQCGEEVYERNDLDRGHLVRRRDPCWGERAVAQRANVDTFHHVNAAPQIPRRFYKIAAWADDQRGGQLAATGYVLDQSALLGRIGIGDPISLRELDPQSPSGDVELWAYRTFQVPITDIETLTGLDFAVITAADRMAMRLSAQPGKIDLGRWVPLDGVEHLSA